MNDPKQQDQQKPSSFGQKIIGVFVRIAALGSGLAIGAATLWGEFYNGLKNSAGIEEAIKRRKERPHGRNPLLTDHAELNILKDSSKDRRWLKGFADLRRGREEALDEFALRMEAKAIKNPPKTFWERVSHFNEWAKGNGDIKRQYVRDVNKKLLEGYGIHSEGLTGMTYGTWQRFRAVGPYTQFRVVFNTIATTAIAFGGMLAFNYALRRTTPGVPNDITTIQLPGDEPVTSHSKQHAQTVHYQRQSAETGFAARL